MNSNVENTIPNTAVCENFIYETVDGQRDKFTQDGGKDLPIAGLKEVVLSFDWEINTDTLNKFRNEVARSQELWSKNNIALALLRILNALGKYIGANRADTHSDAVRLLYSVYNALEVIILSPEMSRDRKVSIVQEELQKYNILRQKLMDAKEVDRTRIAEKSSESPAAGNGAPTSLQADDDSDNDIIPALASIPLSEGTVSQWAVGGTSQCGETEARLTDFFGSDPNVEGQEIVPLTDAAVRSPVHADETASGNDLAHDNLAPEPSDESEIDQPQNIFDDLYAPAPHSPSDDLLLDMHLDTFKEKCAGNNSESCSSGEAAITENEISQKLNDFFDVGADNQDNGCQASSANGVVPLAMAGGDEQSNHPESSSFEDDHKYNFVGLLSSIDKSGPEDLDKEINLELEKIPLAARNCIEVKILINSLTATLKYSKQVNELTPDCIDIIRVLASSLEDIIPVGTDTVETNNQAVLNVVNQFIRWQSGILLAEDAQ